MRKQPQNKKNPTQLKSNKTRSFGVLNWFKNLKTIWKIFLAVLIVLVITGIVILAWPKKNTEIPTYKLVVNAPATMQFNDSDVINFISTKIEDYAGGPAPVSLPEPNNDRQLLPVHGIRIKYDLTSGPNASVFKMNLTDQEIEANAKITPFIKGKWKKLGENAVLFTPDNIWPADQKFTITLNENLFNDDVRIDSRKKSFTTYNIGTKIENLNVYPDLTHKKSMIAVGVFSFDYPIDTKDFKDHVSVRLDGSKIDFTVKFDNYYRTAFITTAPITVKDKTQSLKITVSGVPASTGNGKTDAVEASLIIESADNFFKIKDISTAVVDNQAGNPEQLVMLNLTSSAQNVNWSDYINVYLLPKSKTDDDKSYSWRQDEITDEVLSESKKLNIKFMDFANPTGVYRYAFAYDVSDKDTRYIYVDVKLGITSDMGFTLKNGTNKILRVPYPRKEVKIAGSGALLSLSGGKNLAIMARGGVETAYVNLYKVESSEINHLVSQTYNIFNNMDFKCYSFGPEDMSAVFTKKITFADTSFKKVNYSAVNLGEYLDRTGNDHTGIFIVQVGSSQNQADHNDRRLILLTDLGIIRKINTDQSSSVFVSSLSTGMGVRSANVSVLGRNGVPIWSGQTDATGMANLPKFAWQEYKREREPVVIVVRMGSDVSFIPYSASYEQMVEYSKFEIDGTYESASNPMNAFLFTDRGIYRPGEQFIIGGIVKEKKFKSLAGVPVKLEVTDPRNKTILEKTFSLNSDGMFDVSDRFSDAATIGDYQIRLYSLTDKNKTKDMLGNVSMRVEEFVPDNLKITATIPGAKTQGWIKPTDIKADVTLRNLFGTAATDRRVAARAVLTPTQFSFPDFKDYQFTQNYISGSGLARGSSAIAETVYQDLDDTKTNAQGRAVVDVKFTNNINPGTYLLSVTAEGFEGNSGRSVMATTATRVSDADYLIGYKSSGDLSYIKKNAKKSINLIAINSDAKKIQSPKLTMRVVQKQALTSLVKDYNDYYKYQTVTREKVILTQEITIPASGMNVDLDTKSGGTYYVQIINNADKVLAHIDYYVTGNQNLELKSDQQAELKIKLSKDEYAPGSQIEVSIVAPYTGSGLITIERDRVYAHKWFQASTTSSVQHITLPADFEGTGYVNVSFVRDLNSRDVFTSPYTYAVAPFAADKSARTIKVDLKTPDVVRDKKLTVKYTTNKSARLMIFAVNEGILQVAKYQSPKPLAYFFKKAALQVSTYQILSLILPEYKILREFAKTGGGDYEIGEDGALNKNFTNPFARAVKDPVAFFSGIITTQAGVTGTITFDIPDYFNGGVRVFAVAANNSGVGSASVDTSIQSPVVITPSAPLMAVPEDEFKVNAVVSNMTENSGENAQVKISVKTSDNLTIIGDKTTTLDIPQMTEKLWTFNVKAGPDLGNATIDITARVLDKNGKQLSSNTSSSTLSVRPATLFTTTALTAFTTDKKTTLRDFQTDMYKQLSSKQLFVSASGFVLAKPLVEYLNNYQYPCTEQIVSKTLPYALFPNNAFLGIDQKTATKKINDTVGQLKNRQNDNGSFSWYENGSYSYSRNNESDSDSAYITAYVVQFLTIARDNGFNIPETMLSRGIDYLRTYAGKNIHNSYDANTHAFAIYLITRNGFVTTSYIDGFEEYANKNMKNWQSELSGAYIASSYKLLKQNDLAEKMIEKYKTSDSIRFKYFYDFSNNVSNDATYAYLINQHFDGDISQKNYKHVLDSISAYIDSGNYSSYTSAMAVMALNGSQKASIKKDGITVNAKIGKENQVLTATDTNVQDIFATDVPDNASQLEINCSKCNRDNGVFYALVQQGFDKSIRAAKNGIEVVRDYYNKEGDKITSATVGDEITVRISARTTGSVDDINNIVIADLLPAGFMVINDSIDGSLNFAQTREDRIVFFTSLSSSPSEITYRVKVTAAGKFIIPAVQASSMYNPQIMGVTKTGSFTVSNAEVI